MILIFFIYISDYNDKYTYIYILFADFRDKKKHSTFVTFKQLF